MRIESILQEVHQHRDGLSGYDIYTCSKLASTCIIDAKKQYRLMLANT